MIRAKTQGKTLGCSWWVDFQDWGKWGGGGERGHFSVSEAKVISLKISKSYQLKRQIPTALGLQLTTLSLKLKARADGGTEFLAFGLLSALMEERTHSSMKRRGESAGRQRGRGLEEQDKDI